MRLLLSLILALGVLVPSGAQAYYFDVLSAQGAGTYDVSANTLSLQQVHTLGYDKSFVYEPSSPEDFLNLSFIIRSDYGVVDPQSVSILEKSSLAYESIVTQSADGTIDIVYYAFPGTGLVGAQIDMDVSKASSVDFGET